MRTRSDDVAHYDVTHLPDGHPDRPAALHHALNAVVPPSSQHAADAVGSSARPVAPAVADLLSSAERGCVSLDLLFGIYSGGSLVGACLVAEAPGSAALVFVSQPEARSEARGGTIDGTAVREALDRAVQAAAARSIALLQVLQEPGSPELTGLLVASGFHRLTRLIYLERSTAGCAEGGRVASDLVWRSYRPEDDPLFGTALEATYRQSLDCPELTGLRTTSEVLAGHRATGAFDASLWWLAIRGDTPVGVLLLSRMCTQPALEIAYVGVAQPSRGTGVANALLAKTFTLARGDGAKLVTLAVDERNHPARRMYGRWGFAQYASREAWVATQAGTIG